MDPIKRNVVIEAPKFESAAIQIRGTAPYVQHNFSAKGREMMESRQAAGSVANKDRKKKPRVFEDDVKAATHFSREGWPGIPASGFRNAMISACRIVGFKMTIAKLSVFIEPDGFDIEDGTPLVKIIGKSKIHKALVRNETGVADIRWRPMWEEWKATIHVRWDAQQFSAQDVVNLLSRVGQQVGIGEGRPDSKKSAGMGWGLFEVVS